jgi:hypothetical protein
MNATNAEALKVAIDLLRIPSQVRSVRRSPLPKGTLLLLRLAATETEAEREALALSGRSVETNRAAAIFFIEQILLSSDSDSYRIMGLDQTATSAELRRHMALLLRWLHPDLSNDTYKSFLARRVIRGWDQLKTDERRRRHDEKWNLLHKGFGATGRTDHLRLASKSAGKAAAGVRAPSAPSRAAGPLPMSRRTPNGAKKGTRMKRVLWILRRLVNAHRHV